MSGAASSPSTTSKPNDFVQRSLDVTIKLEPVTDSRTGQVTRPVFSRSGKDTTVLRGLRCSAVIQNYGSVSQSALNLRVFGMPFDLMNEISTLGRLPFAGRNNTVVLEAGDDVNGMAAVYTGTIKVAWADFQSQPDVAFVLQAQTGLYNAVAPAEPLSFGESVDVATIISGLATRMNRTFRNNGVSARLTNRYYGGTLLDQLHACVKDAGIDFEDDGRSIVIWPMNGNRGGEAPVISSANGLVGYPSYTQSGLSLLTRFNPNIGRGGLIKVESSLKPACGTWRVYSLSHALDSETVGGQWFSFLEAADPAYAPIR